MTEKRQFHSFTQKFTFILLLVYMKPENTPAVQRSAITKHTNSTTGNIKPNIKHFDACLICQWLWLFDPGSNTQPTEGMMSKPGLTCAENGCQIATCTCFFANKYNHDISDLWYHWWGGQNFQNPPHYSDVILWNRSTLLEEEAVVFVLCFKSEKILASACTEMSAYSKTKFYVL